MTTHVLWDWNGTLLDDAQLGFDTMNEVLGLYHKPLMPDLTFYRGVFCFPVIDYYTAIGLPREEFIKIGGEWVDIYYKNDAHAALHKDAIAALEYFKARGVKQTILSASRRDLLKQQVAARGILGYFDDILGIDDVYAGSKAHLAHEWLEKTGASPENTLFIGDTLHDSEVASEITCRCVLIANGHQTKEILLSSGRPVYDTLSALLQSEAV